MVGPAGVSGPVLVLNAGSSSVRWQLLDPTDGTSLAGGHVQDIGATGPADHEAAVRDALEDLSRQRPDLADAGPAVIGHRVVHGGPRFHDPVLIDEAVLADIAGLEPLAPLHNQANLAGIRATMTVFPHLPQVAVFDTAFHHTLPPRARTYAVPLEWRDAHHVRRYGFHGISYAYVSRRTCELLGREPADTNLIVLHLGNGASACAIAGGASVDTSMGLSPLEGLVMGTRSGDVDPAMGAYLARVEALDPPAYDHALNFDSGLLGLGGSSDLREVERRCVEGDLNAALALEVMTYRIRKYLGAYAVALGRVDAIVFTAGIGEHSIDVRERVLSGLQVLGVQLDRAANADEARAERRITTDASAIAGYVVPTNEEWEIARACVQLLSA
ncbi:MAG TPA: acetate kinase [Segeticoccus sp.]|uniref:acetate/propionate family kinase n=1 Tax=Segeticoccus sp. TaxID=2706531 RepID=UPI002D7E2768|nr:acetate kinase [Segeticoccus sp.]HET8601944.1 acetate kinase [Segeticoccus sp.]